MEFNSSFPYEGNEPYVFISYSHQDIERVMPILRRLNAEGFRIWYDDGIDPGTEWPESIAAQLPQGDQLRTVKEYGFPVRGVGSVRNVSRYGDAAFIVSRADELHVLIGGTVFSKTAQSGCFAAMQTGSGCGDCFRANPTGGGARFILARGDCAGEKETARHWADCSRSYTAFSSVYLRGHAEPRFRDRKTHTA